MKEALYLAAGMFLGALAGWEFGYTNAAMDITAGKVACSKNKIAHQKTDRTVFVCKPKDKQ